MNRLTADIIIPVGLGHEDASYGAEKSVWDAYYSSPKWQEKWERPKCIIVDDTEAQLGASHARNIGVAQSTADWVFFLDADDRMAERAFEAPESSYCAAYWGRVVLDNMRIRGGDVFPCTEEDIYGKHGARHTLAMGFWVMGDIARSLEWNTNLKSGEDFDYYCRVINRWFWKKVSYPLCIIGRSRPSAHGRGAHPENIDWQGDCQRVIDKYRNQYKEI